MGLLIRAQTLLMSQQASHKSGGKSFGQQLPEVRVWKCFCGLDNALGKNTCRYCGEVKPREKKKIKRIRL